MKKAKVRRHLLSRAQRAILNITIIILLAFWVYIAKGCPPLTAEMQFRRLEKSALIGPSHIIDTFDIPFAEGEQLLLADTQDGVLLFRYDSDSYTLGELHYRKKTGNITVLACPSSFSNADDFDRDNYVELPIMVFDNYPNAVRAELEIEVQSRYTSYRKTHHLESVREKDGYFQFILKSRNLPVDVNLEEEGDALSVLAEASCGSIRGTDFNNPKVSLPATVWLYDKDGNLICKEETSVSSLSYSS